MDASAGTAQTHRSDAAPGTMTAPTAGAGPTAAPESSAPAASAAPVPFAPPPAAPGAAPASAPGAAPLAADTAAANASLPPTETAAGPDASRTDATRAVAAAQPAPPPAPFQPPPEALPSLASLDAGTRSQLPPLKLSMHVYAEEPAQRFVILDGRRLGEGASPHAGVVLEEIRRDGLVLSVDGRRLLLARP
jgi:general secretion pathway protein B